MVLGKGAGIVEKGGEDVVAEEEVEAGVAMVAVE